MKGATYITNIVIHLRRDTGMQKECLNIAR